MCEFSHAARFLGAGFWFMFGCEVGVIRRVV